MTGGAPAPRERRAHDPSGGEAPLPRTSDGGGLLVVVSGPSGVGKGTVVQRIVERLPDAALSISVTTRTPRPGDEPGVDYHFVSDEDFDAMAAQGQLLEWAEVHGARYGTPRGPVEEQLEAGRTVLLEIDVQGGLSVRRTAPSALLIFLAPPSIGELARRLAARGTESDEQRQLRLRAADAELATAAAFDRVIVNDDLGRCVDEVVEAIRSER